MNPSSQEQRDILEAIKAGKHVTGDQANWAVFNGLATQGEDGNTDLTSRGAEALGGGKA
ncbi:hypothetical protein [Pseudoxanthomonas sp. JBR18]|uniref:hypothetical protein n=1 Tax=Pseudoxanthomonas sp. JBR18 TaxID=2969308 RepID=UPI00230565EF|nr:hypothetical protein [Pseudoxanthomonas sp. JBR18]WCE03876.1 hypothetical protein PJ250_17590 [Pseudoxanthomonas sp. JBR18]